MAAVSKVGTPSLVTIGVPPSNKHSALTAGEAIGAMDACYIKNDGKVYKSTGAAANAAAVVDGFAATAYASGQTGITLLFGVEVEYGSSLTPGAPYYLSGTTAGGLDTATSTGGVVPVARAMTTTRIYICKSY